MTQNTITKIMIAAGLSTLLGCYTYAKRDYDTYPAYKGEIALYNIREISKDICDAGTKIDEQSYQCTKKKCFQIEYQNTSTSSGTNTVTSCSNWGTEIIEFNWQDVRKVLQSGLEVKIILPDKKIESMTFKSGRQAFDFAEAVDIYVRESKPKTVEWN